MDLAQVRAFVTAAEQSHFGRAADELLISQQALSKRIRRLEQTLGVRLFVRTARGVELTAAGRRLLAPARQMLAVADAAAGVTSPQLRPLRVDVWGHMARPMRAIHQIVEQRPDLVVDLSMRRHTGMALTALQNDEIDAAFGRVHDLDRPWPSRLSHRLVLLERSVVLMGSHHPLAQRTRLHPDDLRPSTLWLAALNSSSELQGYRARLAEHLGMPVESAGRTLDLDGILDQFRRFPDRVVLWGADWPLPADHGLRLVPLDPTPLFPWSLVWRTDDHQPALVLLQKLLAEVGETEGWLTFDPEHDWLPPVDRADLTLP